MVAIHYADSGAAARSGALSRSLTQATFAALNAPSVLETQPWRWRITQDGIGLHADWARQLTDVDPDGRLLLISCGAALHHARVTLAAGGVGVEVLRLPDPGDPTLLTELRYTGTIDREPRLESLHRAIAVRRSDRRPFADRPLPAGDLGLLRDAAQRAGADAYTVERQMPGASTGAAAYVVVTTPGVVTKDWLAAGEALSAVLLTATAAGLATAPVGDLMPFTPAVDRAPATGRRVAAAIRVGVAGRFGPPRHTGPVTSPPHGEESS